VTIAASGAVQMCAGFHFGMCRYGCSFLEAMLRKLKVLGISVITDMCLPDALEVATVEAILAVARSAGFDAGSLTELGRVLDRVRVGPRDAEHEQVGVRVE
jgi:hypothetical protein